MGSSVPGRAPTAASFNALDRVLAEAAPAELSQARPDATRSPEEPDPPRSRSPTASSPRSASRSARSILPTLAAQYGAGAVPADFAETDQAKQVIDVWVQEQTRDRIEKLFDRIDPTWKLVLANAVYLKADWLVPFAEYQTEWLPFTLADGDRVRGPTMRRLDEMRWTAFLSQIVDEEPPPECVPERYWMVTDVIPEGFD